MLSLYVFYSEEEFLDKMNSALGDIEMPSLVEASDDEEGAVATGDHPVKKTVKYVNNKCVRFPPPGF